MNLPVNKIICGSALETLQTFPAESINCCISSPPYWALRDYGVAGQLGLEKTFEEYIDNLCTIYDEVKRVLRPDGTCWVNLGDTYGGANSRASIGGRAGYGVKREGIYSRGQEKCLCLIPQRFVIEMVNRGWILRNTIIWHKPNPMPSSVKDRFTVDFEYVYFFVKNKRYWFEPQYEPHKDPKGSLERSKYSGHTDDNKRLSRKDQYRPDNCTYNPLGRNKRTVWTIPTQPRSEAHFATFPEKLVEPMIKSGCPEFICTKCGKAREKIWEVSDPEGRLGKSYHNHENDIARGNRGVPPADGAPTKAFKGYTDCGCGAEFRPGIVIDMFMGSGTVARVAAQLRRDYVGIELNPEYIKKIAEPYVAVAETGVSVAERKKGQKGLFE